MEGWFERCNAYGGVIVWWGRYTVWGKRLVQRIYNRERVWGNSQSRERWHDATGKKTKNGSIVKKM
jgi:hypothetical protein